MFLKDQFTGPARRVRDASTELGATMNALASAKQQRAMYAGKAFMGAAALYGMGQVIKKGAEFGLTMKTIGIITNANESQMKALNVQAKDLGTNTMFYAQEVALAMQKLAKAGFSAEQVQGSIDAAVYLAGASGETLENSTDVMNAAIQMFNLPFEQSMKVADMVTEAILGSNIELADYAASLSYVGATARDLNMSLEETSAAIMILGNAGIKGTMAGTAVENMLRYITAASGKNKPKAAKALAALGLTPSQLKDAKGNMLPIVDILKQFGTNLNKLGTADRQNILLNIFGVRGKRAASIMARQLENFDKFMAQLAGSEGRAKEITEVRMSTLAGQLDILSESFKTLGITFTEAIEPWLTPLVQLLSGIIGILNSFMSTWVGGFLTRILAFGLAIKTVMWTVRAIMAGFRVITLTNLATFLQYKGATIAGYSQMSAAVAAFNAAAARGMGLGATGMGGAWVYSKAGKKYAANSPQGQMIINMSKRTRSNPGFMGKMMSGLGLASLFGGKGAGAAGAAGGAGLGGILSGLLRFAGPLALIGTVLWGLYESMALGKDDDQYLGHRVDALAGEVSNNANATMKNTIAVGSLSSGLLGLTAQHAIGSQTSQDIAIMEALKIRNQNPDKTFYDFRGRETESGRTWVQIYVDGEKKIEEVTRKTTKKDTYRKFGVM